MKPLPLLAVLAALVLLPGCWTIRQYDPVTVREIHSTIEEEVEDHRWTLEQFEALGAAPIQVRSKKARHESRISRLESWLRAEEAKRLAEGEE